MPSRCEMNVSGNVMVRRLTVSDSWMTEARELKPGVCVARTLVSNDVFTASVRIVNVRDEPAFLKAGLVLGELTEVIPDVENSGSFTEESRFNHLKEMLSKVDPTVPDHIKGQLKVVVEQFADVFSKSEYDLGKAVGVQHHINTGAARPFRQTLRRHPDKYL